MKKLKWAGIVLLSLFALIALLGYIWLQTFKPRYEGTVPLIGMQDSTEVFFDEYGVPHIYASSEADMYYALGYVHAGERLFQMDLLRRAGGGRLSELFGERTHETDLYLRNLGIDKSAEETATRYFSGEITEPWQQATVSYLQGVNAKIKEGPTPPEYVLLGVEPELFDAADVYRVVGFMSYSFAMGPRTDPLMEKIKRELGPAYLQDLALNYDPKWERIPTETDSLSLQGIEALSTLTTRVMDDLPVAPFLGSNSWVIGPQKSATGEVILCNDTHIAFAQPSVWYEAHLECPGFSFYGNHLAGYPMAFIGHNRFAAVGITMFENDDVDFFVERLNPENPNEVWAVDHWETMERRQEIIHIKDAESDTLEVHETRHGPLVNGVLAGVDSLGTAPVSMYWTYTHFPIETMEASYLLSHGKSMEEYKRAVSLIHAPGLNIMYGDTAGNIAWWTTGKLMKRPEHVNPHFFMDGASGKDDYTGWFDFEENPHNVNPASGYVYSANNQPDSSGGILYPGYYVPENRARRIVQLLDAKPTHSEEDMKRMITDDQALGVAKPMADLMGVLYEMRDSLTEVEKQIYHHWYGWNGQHDVYSKGASIYYTTLSYVLANMLGDELGEEQHKAFLSTFLLRKSIPQLIGNANSPWWDRKDTEGKRESREEIVLSAFRQSCARLRRDLGDDPEQWTWAKTHPITYKHAMGKAPVIGDWLNVGPYPAPGGNEVINNLMYRLDTLGEFDVTAGPAMRRVVNLGHLNTTYSVLPTGQSGNPTSPHYDDQAGLFLCGEFREQKMHREAIENSAKHRLLLVPQN